MDRLKILITGAAGYVGKSLCQALKDKYDITAITRKEFDLTNAKSTIEFFEQKYFDVVIHCAISGGSRLKEDNWDVLDNNLSMYYNLLQCKSHFGKLINVGSGAELYMNDTPYGFSKGVIRKSISYNDNFYNLRIFGVFDENELETRFIKSNINRYIRSQSLIIHRNKLMDFIYMPDLHKIVEYYINNIGPKEINCNYNKAFSLKEISLFINLLAEYKVHIDIMNTETDPPYVGKFENLGIEFIGLENGIINTYNKIKNEVIH